MSCNHFIHSAAGTGKTTKIVSLATKLAVRYHKRVVITTYTQENTIEIYDKVIAKIGYIPSNLFILTWYTFLLNDFVRPYQNLFGINHRINDVMFVNQKSAPYTKKTALTHYISNNKIYSDKISEFAYECNQANNNCIIDRAAQCYDYIFIDEAQDLSGYDFELISALLASKCNIVLVGDARQTSYQTTPSSKNNQYNWNLYKYFEDQSKKKLGKLTYLNKSYRCNQSICSFADRIFPDYPTTSSANTRTTEHDGIFIVQEKDFLQYLDTFKPKILIWDKKSLKRTQGYPALNIGLSKGKTYDRVLIIPTEPMIKFLTQGITDKNYKFYIAVTRARYSVAFLFDKPRNIIHTDVFLWSSQQ